MLGKHGNRTTTHRQTMNSPARIKLRTLECPPLQGAASLDEFELHKLALQWSQSDPIVIRDERDMKSKASWKDRLEPFEHQVQNLITFCRRLPVSIIADDVGLGKTISAGLILSELMVRQRVNRCLVVCTSLIGPQWVEELNSKFGIEGKFQSGSAVRALFRKDYPVVATTYHSAREYMQEASDAGFDMLILDEAHKLRNLYGTPKPPKMATKIREVLEDRVFKYVLMLTATPMQNRVWDLYSLIDCLSVAKGHENPLGNNAEFGARYARNFKYEGWSTTPEGEAFRGILRQYLVRTRRATVRLAFPRRELELRRARATNHDKQLMEIGAAVVNDFYRGSGLIATSLGVAMMSSPQAFRKQLYNMSESKPGLRKYADHVDAVVRQYETPSKLGTLLNICEELRAVNARTWRLVVFTCRIETQHMIVRRMSDAGIKVGVIKGGSAHENQNAIREYSSETPEIHVIVSTDSGAEGVNLQAGNVLVNYDLPWNPMVLEQRIGRVQRLGSKFENVVIFNLAVAGSVEDRIVARLSNKLTEISESVGDIESILEATTGGKEDSFEAQVRELVTKSLKGQDIQEQQRLAEESIVKAKKQLERHEKEIDAQLGDLDALHTSGVRPPELSVSQPDKPLRDFVLMALRHEGCIIEDRPDLGADVARVQNTAEQSITLATFDRKSWRDLREEQPSGFRRIDLYQRGQPAFERLLQRWLTTSQSFVIDAASDDETRVGIAADNWVQRCRGGQVSSVRIIKATTAFAGTVQVSGRAVNGVDRYEKLVSCPVSDVTHGVSDEDFSTASGQPLRTWKVDSQLRGGIRNELEQDGDLNEFAAFYKARLAEELPRVGHSEIRRQKVTDDFTVTHESTVVGSTGLEYSVCHCRLLITIDGHDGYQAELEMVPLSGVILSEPVSWAECEQSKGSYPAEFLAECDISKQTVLRHLLVSSEESNRRALSDFTEVCPRTSKTALKDEFAESSLSRQKAVVSEFTPSQVSDRIYFAEELTVCEFSGVRLGQDEASVSDVSGQTYRTDETATCSFSNQRGHQSEFHRCAESGRLLTADSLVASDVSGKLVHPDLLVASERPPNRQGLATEATQCEQTGRTLLTDEVAQCSFTGKIVDDSLLKPCEESNEPVLGELLEQCEESEKLVSPAELVECAVSGRKMLRRLCDQSAVSGAFARSGLLVNCEIMGALALPSEMTESGLSKRKFRSDESAMCSFSGTVGHQSEFMRCEVSQRLLDPAVVARSDVSGKAVHPDLLVPSERPPHRKGLKGETIVCAESGRTLLSDEVARCEITSKLVDTELLDTCDETGVIGLKNKLAACDLTGKRVVPSILKTCVVTGKRVLLRLGQNSDVSGKFAIESEVICCELTNAVLLPEETVVSDLSQKRFRSDEAVKSDVSNRVAHRTETASCEYTQRDLLSDEVGISDVTGKKTAESELVSSAKSGRRGRPEECVECSVTQKVLLNDEVATSAVSGLVADKSLFRPSSITGRLALANELIDCEFSGAQLLPEESAISSVSGRKVDSRLLLKSAFSKYRALPDEMITCTVSGRRGVPHDGKRCEESGEWVSLDHLVECTASGKTVREDFCIMSAVSGRKLLKSLARRSFQSGQWLHPDEAVRCHWRGTWLASSEAETCSQNAVTFEKDLITNGVFTYFGQLMFQQIAAYDGSRFLHQFKNIPSLKRTTKAFYIHQSESRFLTFRLLVETRWRLDFFYVGFVARLRKNDHLEIVSSLTKLDRKSGKWSQLE